MITPFQTRAAERRAKIAAEIDAAKKTLEDATTVGAGFWVSYIFLMFYIAVSAGAVTHVDLLLENPVKLPFLNLDLPLVGFFFLAPILFIVMHVFTLSKLVMLAEKAKRFLEALEKLPKAEAREKLRRSLPSNIFTQFMAGPSEISGGGFGALLRLMGWITMALAPALLLLFLQIQFLPYHSLWLTWEHRAALATDLALLWWLWRRALNTAMLAPPAPSGLWENAKYLLAVTGRSVALLIGLALSAVAVFASLVATYPTEWETSPLAFAPRLDAHRAALTEAIFGEKSSCARGGDVAQDDTNITQVKGDLSVSALFPRWPCNTLHVEEFNIFEALKLEDRNKLGGREFTVRLRERRLEGANMAYAKLGKADLRDAKLMGATLDHSELQGATLDRAQLQGATLDRAQLQGATLSSAELQGATFKKAKLQGAMMDFTKLQGASFDSAHLDATRLDAATLQGATLEGANINGAILRDANIQGASLKEASMDAVTLGGAYVWRAVFTGVNLDDLNPGIIEWRPLTYDHSEEKPWSKGEYEKLRTELTTVIPEGKAREQALKRIEKLDCKQINRKSDCISSKPMKDTGTSAVIDAEYKGIKPEDYAQALYFILKRLLCKDDRNAIYILRGVTRTPGRNRSLFNRAAAYAPKLAEKILSSDCPVSATLSAAEKYSLQQVKQAADLQPTRNSRTKDP